MKNLPELRNCSLSFPSARFDVLVLSDTLLHTLAVTSVYLSYCAIPSSLILYSLYDVVVKKKSQKVISFLYSNQPVSSIISLFFKCPTSSEAG